jgi:hypothetical protein
VAKRAYIIIIIVGESESVLRRRKCPIVVALELENLLGSRGYSSGLGAWDYSGRCRGSELGARGLVLRLGAKSVTVLGGQNSIYGSERPFLRRPGPIFREILAVTCRKTISLSTSKCLSGLDGSLIP